MRKFFVKSNQINDKIINIIGDDVNHIKNVLRLEKDTLIKICDFDNKINYICKIDTISKEKIECSINQVAKNEAEGKVNLVIYQGLPKSDKMELIIQKGKDEQKKIERWQKISEASAKQSGRDIVPIIDNIKNLSEIDVGLYDIVFLAYEEEKENSIKDELKNIEKKESYNIAVIIGPEGGITEKEVSLLREKGAKVVTLGNRILRTETVALYLSSVIMYELEM